MDVTPRQSAALHNANILGILGGCSDMLFSGFEINRTNQA